MLRVRVITALLLALSLLLSLTFFTPNVTLAGSGTVTDCTMAGIAQTLSQTYLSDPTTPVVVTFDCPDPVIDFGGYITINVPDVPITIDGANNGTPIVLDGNDSTRFFAVDDDASFTLKNITLQDGATTNAAYGGAIRVASGSSLTIISTTFLNNYASERGGAIYSEGTVNISNSTFEMNEAGLAGGAIGNYQGKLNISNSTFDLNKASNAGAIDNYGTLSITGSTFTTNTATSNGGSSGGAIVNYASSATITRSTFIQNKSFSGGAIYNGLNATLDSLQSSFISNTAVLGGGAIFNITTLNVNQSTFDGNSASQGGALSTFNTLRVAQSTFAENIANDSGGALSVNEGQAHVTATTFSGNTAGSGSVVRAAVAADLTNISWSTIVQPANTSPALYITHPVTLEGVILAGDGDHCQFDGGAITDTYTFDNDSSCNLSGTGSRQGIPDLGLDALTTTTINGVDQTYYPLLETSPAIGAGPTTCETDLIDGPDPDQIGNSRPYHYYCDIGAIESTFTTNMLCTNRYNGQLRMTTTDGCSRSETFIRLPNDAPITLCLNKWNGSSRLATNCSRSEQLIVITGDRTISACANQWNGALRIANQCTRSETHHWL